MHCTASRQNRRSPPAAPARRGPAALGALAALVLLAAVPGCLQRRVVKSGWDDFPSDPKPQVTQRTAANPNGDRDWAIRLTQFTGKDRSAKAYNLVRKAQSQAGMADLWVQDSHDTATLYRGHFNSPDKRRVQALLGGAQNIELDGQRPFAHAKLVPISASRHATTDPLDLRQYAGQGDYSLQVAFFDKSYGDGDFRAAAEKKARKLRAKGYRAFYYHGPQRSMVTIGLFTQNDFVLKGKTQAYGPRIKALQKKFPYNKGNGEYLKEIVNGKSTGAQPSFLVRIF